NNWNALGYSQAFANESWLGIAALQSSFVGGVWLSSAYVAAVNSVLFGIVLRMTNGLAVPERGANPVGLKTISICLLLVILVFPVLIGMWGLAEFGEPTSMTEPAKLASVVSLQPNVPMSGLTYERWQTLRQRHIFLAESALAK